MIKYENQREWMEEYHMDDNVNEMYNIPHYFCDDCGDECSADELYLKDNQHLCKYCLAEKHTKLIDAM